MRLLLVQEDEFYSALSHNGYLESTYSLSSINLTQFQYRQPTGFNESHRKSLKTLQVPN